MADQPLPFLRGTIERIESYRSPRGGSTSSTLPPRDPKSHRQHLLTQLDTLRTAAESRPTGTRDPAAQRELIAVHPAQGHELAQSKLGDKRSDVRVVGEDPLTQMVLLDAAGAQLPALRKKIREFSTKKAPSGSPKHARLIAPIERILLASLHDLADERVMDAPTDIPRWLELQNYAPVARAGEISPHTTAKPNDADRVPNKPDVVFEGGNVASDGALLDSTVGTLTALTTGHRWGRPLAAIWATSEATARASHLAASIWTADATLRPETVRGLIVHSADWTEPMFEQFGSLDDRLRICGYGTPDPSISLACTRDRATVLVEDVMPNGVLKYRPKKNPPKRPTTPREEPYYERQAKYFRLPVDDQILLDNAELEVELRVTLSYFAEVHSFRRRAFRGLDLAWDMQGPTEGEDEFRWRINQRIREQVGDQLTKPKKSFDWAIGPQRRARGTVQSDRWRGAASLLAGHKLIAVMPRSGWWNEREDFKEKVLPFSLLVTIQAPGLDIYTPLANSLRNVIEVEV